MVHIALLNKHNQVIYSTIPEELSIDSIDDAEVIICDIKQIKRRQIRIGIEEYEIILISYDQNITNKIFKHYIDALKLIAPIILKTNNEVTEKELKKTRRLKHNITSYASKIQQELYKLIPQESVARGGVHGNG